LDRIFARLERVHILSKDQRRRGVDGKAREVLQGIGIGLSLHALLPASTQPIGDELQCREKAFELLWGKCAHDEVTLRAPSLSLN
jgi:hypothetical protein